MSDINLIWLYSSAALCWLDVFLLVFMLSALWRLKQYTHQLLFITAIRQHEATIPEQSRIIKEVWFFLYLFHYNNCR